MRRDNSAARSSYNVQALPAATSTPRVTALQASTVPPYRRQRRRVGWVARWRRVAAVAAAADSIGTHGGSQAQQH